jgi:pimeloyl-ACP methyl ester carboxylesterase
MAKDAVTFIRALGFDQVDLHGSSMGGMIAQVIAQDEPELVRKLILTGTGPAGGKGMKEVVWVAQVDTLRGLLSRQDPKEFLIRLRGKTGSDPTCQHPTQTRRPNRVVPRCSASTPT